MNSINGSLGIRVWLRYYATIHYGTFYSKPVSFDLYQRRKFPHVEAKVYIDVEHRAPYQWAIEGNGEEVDKTSCQAAGPIPAYIIAHPVRVLR